MVRTDVGWSTRLGQKEVISVADVMVQLAAGIVIVLVTIGILAVPSLIKAAKGRKGKDG